jgi:hypothetical protein
MEGEDQDNIAAPILPEVPAALDAAVPSQSLSDIAPGEIYAT